MIFCSNEKCLIKQECPYHISKTEFKSLMMKKDLNNTSACFAEHIKESTKLRKTYCHK